MRARLWFDLPFVPDKEGRLFQNLLETHINQNDREYILNFLSHLPVVHMYIQEDHVEDKKPAEGVCL